MKQIEAVIDQFKLEEVRSALEEMGIEDVMESTIKCPQKGRTMMFRGATFMTTIVEKVKLDIIATEDSVKRIVDAIGTIAGAGGKEDCRIAIHPCLKLTQSEEQKAAPRPPFSDLPYCTTLVPTPPERS